jgi:hypothetical protein
VVYCKLLNNPYGGEIMNMKDIAKIASKNGVKAGKMNKTQLVRAIQKAEGNNECFATAQVQTCGQMNCLWREDCK